MEQTRGQSEKPLWLGAVATAISAVVFPRLEAVKNEDVAIWDLDGEAMVLAPVIIVLTLAVFGLLAS
jgi:hypothetical protein